MVGLHGTMPERRHRPRQCSWRSNHLGECFVVWSRRSLIRYSPSIREQREPQPAAGRAGLLACW